MSTGVILSSTAALTGTQIKQLRELIALKFTLDDLEMVVREDLNRRLAALVELPKPFDQVVFNLIAALERENCLRDLVRAVGERRPHLKSHLDAILSGAEQFDPDRDTDHPRRLRQFGNEFHQRREWFGYLNAYKELHELLHNLSGMLRQIANDADRRTKDSTPIPDTTAADLRQWVDDARRWSAQAEFPGAPPLCVWVPRFAAAVEAFLGSDPAAHPTALANIARLPGQQLGHLNGELVACARRLDTKRLIVVLDNLPIRALGLTDTVARFRDPCARLEALIDDHDICQQIDTELRLADSLAAPTPTTLLGWDDVQQWLDQLGIRRPNDSRVTRTCRAADAFHAAPTAESFQDLHEKFSDLFKKTDEALLRVTNQLVLAAVDLAEKLEELR